MRNTDVRPQQASVGVRELGVGVVFWILGARGDGWLECRHTVVYGGESGLSRSSTYVVLIMIGFIRNIATDDAADSNFCKISQNTNFFQS